MRYTYNVSFEGLGEFDLTDHWKEKNLLINQLNNLMHL